MRLVKINKITKSQNNTYDITVENDHNFFANNMLIHNCDYTGNIKVLLYNVGEYPYEVQIGDKIAQAVMQPVYKIYMQEIDEMPIEKTERDQNGFGSSGR